MSIYGNNDYDPDDDKNAFRKVAYTALCIFSVVALIAAFFLAGCLPERDIPRSTPSPTVKPMQSAVQP